MYTLIQSYLAKSIPIYKLFDMRTGKATSWGYPLAKVLRLPLTPNMTLVTELKYSPEYTVIAESPTPITITTHPELFI